MQLLRSYVNDSMLMNLKVANNQQATVSHQNISTLFQAQPTVLTSPLRGNESAIKSAVAQQGANVMNTESMEVSVDPCMFLADEESIVIEDDEETVSAAEAKSEMAKLEVLKKQSEPEPDDERITFEDNQAPSDEIRNNGKYVCTSCPEHFSSNTELQNHVVTHLIISSPPASSTKTTDGAIFRSTRKKKVKDEKLRSRRKKIIIRINPSPSRRHGRERAKVLPKFSCAICVKSLSSKRNLILHQDTHKEANGKFRCDGEGCKKLFAKLENFVKHRQEHEKPKRRNQNEK